MCQQSCGQEGFIWRLRRSVALVTKRQGWAVHVAPFPDTVFSSCSISAVQWLCNANKKSDIPAKRLYCFFSSLYSVLVSYEIFPSLPHPAGSVMRQRRPVGRTQNGRTLVWLMLSQWTALKEGGGVGSQHASEMQRH